MPLHEGRSATTCSSGSTCFQIHLPPLRDRGDDIEDLADALPARTREPGALRSRPRPCIPQAAPLARQRARTAATPWSTPRSSPAAARCCRNTFPGHRPARRRPIRPDNSPRWCGAGLRERAAALDGNEPTGLYDELLALTEPPLIAEVLRQTGGNRVVASRWLSLVRATVRKMIARHLPDEASGGDED